MPSPDPAAGLPWPQRVRLLRRHWEHRCRNRLLLIFRAFCLRRRGQLGAISTIHAADCRETIRNILIIRTGKAIGDAIMSLALVPECRRLFPKARVELLLRDRVRPLFVEGAGVDDVLEFRPKFLNYPRAAWNLCRTLRTRRYDLVIACDNPRKSSFTTLCLTLLTRAPLMLGFENDESRGFLNVRVSSRPGETMIANLLGLLSPLGGTLTTSRPRLTPPSRLTGAADALLGADPKPVLIFASNHWRKSWPLDSFLRIASELIRRGHRVMLAFGPGDDRIHSVKTKDWQSCFPEMGSVLHPQPLQHFAAILARCPLFIANDCGPYHLAVAVGARCIGVFVTEEARREFGYDQSGRLAAVHHPVSAEAERVALDIALKFLGGAPGAATG
ncbi:MAG: glycosyltransferase family 9 protein [Verrucomicrobia bacterium]|nr:glycosyltransferase family 9 protein [Verrucomicrobiota bacterium]